MAVYIHVSERDSLRARLIADVDAAIERQHLPQVMGIDAAQPEAQSAVHLFFLNEKVRPQ